MKKITNTTKTEVQTKNTITVKTEETKERPKCTHTKESFERDIKRVEKQLVQNFTEQEKQEFFRLINKMSNNL